MTTVSPPNAWKNRFPFHKVRGLRSAVFPDVGALEKNTNPFLSVIAYLQYP